MKTKLFANGRIPALSGFLTIIFIIVIPALTQAQWTAPVNLSPNAVAAGLNESMGSCIGTSGDTVHVVWTDKRSATAKINVLYYTHSADTGLTWSAPVAITSLTGNAWNPAIAVAGSSVHVVWREIDTLTNSRKSYYKHSLDGGSTWGAAIFLDSTSDWPGVTVSGNNVYMVNDRHITASNSEIFFMRSLDNGATWSGEQRLTFADGRSEDEAIHAEGSHVHMSWNDNRVGQFQILYKESNDYGVTWDSDLVVIPVKDYNTMVWSDGAHVDVIATGAPSGRYQLLLAQSADTGATWGASMDLSNDTAHTYFLPDMVRDGSDLHVVCNSGGGSKYFHSANGGTTWASPVILPGAAFIAYSGCALHIIYVDANKKINYLRNPTGNAGHCATATGVAENKSESIVSVYPNPSIGKFLVSIPSGQIQAGNSHSIEIYNMYGACIHQHISTSENFQIDLSAQPSGIYFLDLKTGNESFRKKLIIQK